MVPAIPAVLVRWAILDLLVPAILVVRDLLAVKDILEVVAQLDIQDPLVQLASLGSMGIPGTLAQWGMSGSKAHQV
jgi:hypothetical protein